MKFNVFLLLLFEINFAFTENVQYNMSQFYRMPTLNRFDNYHECMGVYGEDALYCVADTFIKPDSDSDLYNLIAEYNKDTKKHFRHDYLLRGLCVNTCRKIVEKLGFEADEYLVEEFPIFAKMIFHDVDYFNSQEDRVKYAELINKCVNVELVGKYQLRGFSKIEYCLSEKHKPPLDFLDKFAAFLFLAIFSIVILSSLYDRILRNLPESDEKTHYEIKLKSKTNKILTIFSLRRNWSILTAPTNPDISDLSLLHGIRGLCMTLVILGHTFYFAEFLPSANPEVNEGSYSSAGGMLIFNGLNVVQTFLVMSGFLTTFLLLSRTENRKISSISLFFKAFLLRYIRFAPILALVLLLQATWLYRLGMGPVFNKINYAEQEFCRRHWWKNMLFIDVYTNPAEKCLFQTWYLDCDFWLSAAGVLFVLIIRKLPKLKFWLLSFIIGISIWMFGYVVWVNKLEPLPIFPPETLKNRVVPLTADEPNYFELIYSQTHMNMGNYFIGVATGLLYYNLKKSGKNFPKNMLTRFLFFIVFVSIFLNLMSAHIFYNNDFEKPSVFILVTALVLKHSWGLIAGYLILSMIARIGWFFPDLFYHPGWKVIGKASYSGYMFHNFVVQLLVMNVYQPIYIDLWKLMALSIGATFCCILVGIFFTLAVELPVASIVQLVMGAKEEKSEGNGISLLDRREKRHVNGSAR